MDILERFISYIKIDTQSSEESSLTPSTKKQFDLARVLEKEMKEMGVSDVRLNEKCYLYGRIPSNIEGREAIRLGFISHMDTAPSFSGKDIKPRLIENYDGSAIELGHGEVLDPKVFPELLSSKGDDLLVTDGTTLLGADDKAGVTEIMAMAEYLLSHPEIKHGDVLIGFTPDEEIGRGADFFDVEGFGADYAYTVDGGTLGEIEYENFNAASAILTVKGVNVHPGSAKDKMINALKLAMEFNLRLPEDQVPEKTEGYEGFFHLCEMKGDESEAILTYIIRDHDMDKFNEKKKVFEDLAKELNEKYKDTAAEFKVEVKDSYYNMREKIEPYAFLIDFAKEAFKDNGIKACTVPIRGGTDGARLSFEGLPCPNLCTGGENFHGKYEYLNVNSMRKMEKVLVSLVKRMAEK